MASHTATTMATTPSTIPREVTSGGDASIAAHSRDAVASPPGFSSANMARDPLSANGASGVTHPAIARVQRQSTISNVVFRGKERIEKIGHRRVNLAGVVSYKKTPAGQLKRGIQMGLEHFIGQISNKPVRDLLIQDFEVIESVHFPSDGSQMTVAHGSSDFRFECFAPDGFKHFRQGFGIDPSDFLISLCKEPLKDLSNPGASGSLFFLTDDDEFIIKTVDHKEAKFLQKLLPGYYMNLIQNPRTLLPKFYGLYCYSSLNKNIRLVIMNNLLPSSVKMHEKYDLKGSTFKRKASKHERDKREPTLKDLDFMELHPKGIILGPVYRKAIMDTIEKDCRVLESFNIMDFSLLLGIHNLDKAAAEEKIQTGEKQGSSDCQSCSNGRSNSEAVFKKIPSLASTTSADHKSMLVRQPSYHKRLANFPTAFEVIQSTIEADGSGEFTNSDLFTEVDEDIIKFTGGIPARSEKGERLLLFLGVIDILQQYKLKKKMEHAWKAAVHDGNSVSVTRPDFYKQRFLSFISEKIFPKLRAVVVPRPSSSSLPCRGSVAVVPTDAAAVTATTNPDGEEVVSPNNISITIDDAGNSSPFQSRRDERSPRQQPPEVAVDQPSTLPHPPTKTTTTIPPNEGPQSFPVFGSPSDSSVLTHDLTTGEVASETPSVHPPAFSTPTQRQLYSHDSKVRPSSRSMASEAISDEICASTATNNITLCVDNHITKDESSSYSLHADSNGIVIGVSEVDHDDDDDDDDDGGAEHGVQFSHFDSSASSDVLRRIQQLEDSSLDSFVGEIPSELGVASSLLESVIEESADHHLEQSKVILDPHIYHHPVINNTHSSSGVSSVPTSTVKPTQIEIKPKDDETTSLDPTSSFVTSDKQQILTSRTSGLEEDTSGISGISPLEEPSSSEPIAAIGGGEEVVEPVDHQDWRKLKISYDPPSSSSVGRDGSEERSFVL